MFKTEQSMHRRAGFELTHRIQDKEFIRYQLTLLAATVVDALLSIEIKATYELTPSLLHSSKLRNPTSSDIIEHELDQRAQAGPPPIVKLSVTAPVPRLIAVVKQIVESLCENTGFIVERKQPRFYVNVNGFAENCDDCTAQFEISFGSTNRHRTVR